jgi:hypothetical protein
MLLNIFLYGHILLLAHMHAFVVPQSDKFRARLVWVIKFNKHCSTFVLFDKKFLILD